MSDYMAVIFISIQGDQGKRQALRMEKRQLLTELNDLKSATSTTPSVQPDNLSASIPEPPEPETSIAVNEAKNHGNAFSTGASFRIEEIKVMRQNLFDESLIRLLV